MRQGLEHRAGHLRGHDQRECHDEGLRRPDNRDQHACNNSRQGQLGPKPHHRPHDRTRRRRAACERTGQIQRQSRVARHAEQPSGRHRQRKKAEGLRREYTRGGDRYQQRYRFAEDVGRGFVRHQRRRSSRAGAYVFRNCFHHR
jgi:hypothetical protein